MVGTATGLAEGGYIPYVYSIATFASMRAFEFIRNGPILHRLPVRIVAVGGGWEYSTAGPTHHGIEDVGIMRTQPGIALVVPADPQQVRTAMLATGDLTGPVYFRIGKDDKAHVPGLDGRFGLGRLEVVCDGADLLILAMGSVASEARIAADPLRKQGINTTVGVVASVSPAPTEDLTDLLSRFPTAVTVETHYVNGGLGSLVCEAVAEGGLPCRVTRCGIRATPTGVTGSQEYLNHTYGLTSDAIVTAALGQIHLQLPSCHSPVYSAQ